MSLTPRLLDLFCNAGGAGMGYHRAGFDVFGVDLHPQKNYPFPFYQGDATAVLEALLRGEKVRFVGRDGAEYLLGLSDFAGLHASPPCQGYTEMVAPGQVGAPLLIDPIRSGFQASGKSWIIENVVGARWAMQTPVMLCGSMFDLGAQGCQLQRHRLFESNIAISAPSPCRHDARPVIGVYGGHARRRAASAGGRSTRDVWVGGHRAAMSEAMGMTWATCVEMSEAIPPAYSEWLGKQLMTTLSQEATDWRELLG